MSFLLLSVTDVPTSNPSMSPVTDVPTSNPSKSPSDSPVTDIPTSNPSMSPVTDVPTSNPSMSPSVTPTRSPTNVPSISPSTTSVPSISSAPTLTPSPTLAPTQCGSNCDGDFACPIPLPADVTIECGSCIEEESCNGLGDGGSGKHSRLVFYLPLSTPWLLTFISFILVMYVLQLMLASDLVLDLKVANYQVRRDLILHSNVLLYIY